MLEDDGQKMRVPTPNTFVHYYNDYNADPVPPSKMVVDECPNCQEIFQKSSNLPQLVYVTIGFTFGMKWNAGNAPFLQHL